jgi:hypothetical protein
VDLKNKRCIFEGCDKQPVYGIKDTKDAIYCVTHKSTEHVDLKNKRCIFEGCNTRASYGYLFNTLIHCATHKSKLEYIAHKLHPRCSIEPCAELPTFSESNNNYPKRCELHALSTDVNVIEKKCGVCGLYSIIGDSGKCNDCFEFVNIKKHRLHIKEEVIKNLLEVNNISCVHDKIPDGSCNKYRPDFIIDCNTHFVIIEVDENQHSNYLCECEQARMINISQDVGGGLSVVFIRYNPDNYRDTNNKRNTITIGRRHTILLQTIQKEILNVRQHPLSVIYLFYDMFEPTNVEVFQINI